MLFIHKQSYKFPLCFLDKSIITLKRQHDTEVSDRVPGGCWRCSSLPSVTRADPPSCVTLDFQARRQVSGRRGRHPSSPSVQRKAGIDSIPQRGAVSTTPMRQELFVFPKSFWEAVIFFPLTRPPVDAPCIRFLAVGKIRLENLSKHLFPGPVPSSPAAPCQQLQQPRGEGRRGARRGWTPDAPSFRGSRPHVCQPPTVSALT